MTPRAHRAMRRIRLILREHPKLERVALGLVRALGPVDAADELAWLAEHVR